MGGGARFRVGIALSAIGEGLREAARDFGGASLRCVCLPLSPAGSGHPPHRFITPSSGGFRIPGYKACYDGASHINSFCGCGPTPFFARVPERKATKCVSREREGAHLMP